MFFYLLYLKIKRKKCTHVLFSIPYIYIKSEPQACKIIVYFLHFCLIYMYTLFYLFAPPFHVRFALIRFILSKFNYGGVHLIKKYIYKKFNYGLVVVLFERWWPHVIQYLWGSGCGLKCPCLDSLPEWHDASKFKSLIDDNPKIK